MVRVLAVGETADGAQYMALEYLDGLSLRGGITTSWRRKTEIGQRVGTHGFYPPRPTGRYSAAPAAPH